MPDSASLPSEYDLLSATLDPAFVDDSPGTRLRSRVLHLQDSDVRSTWWRIGGTAQSGKALGVEAEWVHLAVRRLGGRECYVEFGVRDRRGQTVVIRCSTFKVRATTPAIVLASGIGNRITQG